MAMRFLHNDINFTQDSQEAALVVTGNITNNSDKDFNAVVFRMTLFIKTKCIGNLTITMNGFRNGQTKTFRESVSELGLGLKIAPGTIRYEIFPESAY